MDKKELIEKTLMWFSELSGVDVIGISKQIADGKYSFSGTFSEYVIRKACEACIKCYLSGDFDASLDKCREVIYQYVDKRANGHSLNVEKMKEYASFLMEASERIEEIERKIIEWEESEKAAIKAAGFGFDGDDMEYSAYDLYSIKNSIGGSNFHLYRYKIGDRFEPITKFRVNTTVIASDNINDLITYSDKNEWSVTIGLYIEKKIDLSYFVITFSLMGNVYVLTDRIIYQNTDQINRLRNGGRRFSEKRENELWFLPYSLIDKIIENRKNSEAIVKDGNSEIWLFPLKEYFSLNLYYMVKYTMGKIVDGYCVEDTVSCSTLAITEGHVDMKENTYFRNLNSDKLDKIVDEIYSDTSSESLALTNCSLVKEMGVSTALMTIQEVKRNTQYLAHKKNVERHEKAKWGEMYSAQSNDYGKYSIYRNQVDELHRIMVNNIERLKPFLFCGKVVRLHDVDNQFLYYGMNSEEHYRYSTSVFIESNKCDYNSMVQGRTCMEDGNTWVKKNDFVRCIDFKKYTEILALLEFSRESLPPLLRDYISYHFIPYFGNSILDNVKPEYSALECDYASKTNPNSFSVSFPFCGNCSRKLYKKYMVAEDATIVISGKRGYVIEILPTDVFEQKYLN